MKEQEKKATVLVADDNKLNLILTKAVILKLGNFEVFTAENGQQAVEMYIEEQPNYILMDIQMPVMNGIEATREIRKIERGTNYRAKIIALSMMFTDETRKMGSEAGMDDFLVGPRTSEEIERVLQ
jgi:CheY-like chemotaxis protein